VIIACPSCGARFNLDPAKLLPAGRNVRCAKCGHRWRQMPEGHTASEERPPAAPAPEQKATPATPEPAPESAPPPDETESHPPSPPETPAQMAESLAAIAEQVTGARPQTPAGGQPPGQPGEQPGGEVPDAESNPIARLARRTGAQGAIPIPVPPSMKPMRPAKRSSHLGLILVAGLVVGFLITAYAFRDVIARTVPGADAIYSLLGVSIDNPAADLEISIDNARINTNEQTGQKIFDVTATVFNRSEHPMNLPPLMVIPVDDAGSPMEPMAFRLQENVIEPGQNIKFRKSFEGWPPTAPNFELRVATAE
jgi:predicted Zn finger-like uncharacterized protein